jgi:hypothetical protein
MHPIDIAHTLAQQRVNARGQHHGPSPCTSRTPGRPLAPIGHPAGGGSEKKAPLAASLGQDSAEPSIADRKRASQGISACLPRLVDVRGGNSHSIRKQRTNRNALNLTEVSRHVCRET